MRFYTGSCATASSSAGEEKVASMSLWQSEALAIICWFMAGDSASMERCTKATRMVERRGEAPVPRHTNSLHVKERDR